LALLVLRLIHGFGWGAVDTASGTIASDIIPKSRLGEGGEQSPMPSAIKAFTWASLCQDPLLFCCSWFGTITNLNNY